MHEFFSRLTHGYHNYSAFVYIQIACFWQCGLVPKLNHNWKDHMNIEVANSICLSLWSDSSELMGAMSIGYTLGTSGTPFWVTNPCAKMQSVQTCTIICFMVCCMVACSKFPREMLSSVNVCMCIVFVFSVWLVLLYSFGFLHNRLILKLMIHQAFRCATRLICSPANILHGFWS